jgi:hypothetical protein
MNALENPEGGELNDTFAQARPTDAQFASELTLGRQAVSWF